MPITSWPAARQRAAATALSTPPLMATTTRLRPPMGLGVCPGNHGERGERAGERERQAQRRPTRCGARDARRELVAAGGRSEQPSGSAAVAALPRIVRRSRHGYSDSLLEETLGREHADDARVALRGEIERARQRLEGRLDDVVRVPARGHADVKIHARLVGHREEKVIDQLDVEAPDLRLLDPDVVDEEGPARGG